MHRVTSLVAVTAAATLALAACSTGSSSSSSSSGAASDTASTAASSTSASVPATSSSIPAIKVGMAYDIGGRGDKSFNDSAGAGLDKAKTDLGIETKELSATTTETEADKEARLKLLADAGFNPVIAVGFAYAGALKKVAAAHPETKFGIIDDSSITAANVTSLTFAEQEGSYLVGVAAALKSKKGTVGYIGGCLVPLLQKFEAGFTAGAKATNPAIKVQVKYLSTPAEKCKGFNDPLGGTESANGMYDNGVDVIFAAAGGSGTGVFKSAKAKSTLAIGVDSDQYQSAAAELKPFILTSMLKRVDTAVYSFVKSFKDGTPLTGVQVFNLKLDGVGYATSGTGLDDATKAKMDAAKAAIIGGTVTVPTVPTK